MPDTISLVAAFVATSLSVALKANQNLTVLYRRYALILPTSLGLGLLDYFIINTIVTQGMVVAIATGLGGGAGILLVIVFDRYWRRTHEGLPTLPTTDIRDRESP